MLLLATAVLLAILDSADFGPLNRVRANALAVGRPVASVMTTILRPVSAGWNGIVHYDDIQEENGALRRQVAELEGQVTEQLAGDLELQAVLAASEIRYIGDAKTVTARVVTDRETAVARIVEIDKGADHGLRAKLPVVTAGGLVGHIDVVSDKRSTIKLLTSDDVAVGVRTNGGLALTTGVDKGDEAPRAPDESNSRRLQPQDNVAGPELQPEHLNLVRGPNSAAVGGEPVAWVDRANGRVALALELSPTLQERFEDGEIEPGSLFVTSGLNDSNYPPGIPVGYLRRSRVQPTIESAADLTQLTYLSILIIEVES